MLVFSFLKIYNFYKECDIYERTTKQFKICLEICKKSKKYLFLYLIINIFLIAISILIPILSAKIIVELTNNKFHELILIATTIFMVENIRSTAHYFQSKFAQIIYRETFIKVQTELGKNILELENSVIDKNSSGVFIQRLTNDSSRLADIFVVLNLYLTKIITDIGIFITIFIINKLCFIVILFFVIVRYLIDYKRIDEYTKNDKTFRKKQENISGLIGEMVRGIRDIKMLNSEKSFISNLETKIIDLNNTRYDMQDVNRKYIFIRGFVRDLSDLSLILLLVLLIKKDVLSVSYALIIYNYQGRIPNIVDNIAILLEKIKDFNLSSNRIFSIMNNEKFKKEKFGKTHINNFKGNIEFRNVSFSYDDNPVLEDINFKINAKEDIAIVGKSGAGKTTIFNLINKMYVVDKGKILIDNKDINALDKDSIRSNITIINQSPYIFNLSIKDNLKLIKEDLTEEEMINACKLACLDNFINSLPQKYDTIIGEGGINLSGGQKQRLAIARAFIQNSEIILFDEATSALDNETQNQIVNAINNMKNKFTTIIIAHRLSTIINCKKIMVLNNGIIEDIGTHEYLIKNNKTYKNLYKTEFNKESSKEK